jgi:CRP-like cAMP-binding protein
MDSKELKDKKEYAEGLYTQNRLEEAREAFEELREFGAEDPKIFARLGDTARKLSDDFSAMEDYKLAAEAYSKCGATIKAIAICKMILTLHPSKTHIEKSLSALSSQLKVPEGEEAEVPAASETLEPLPEVSPTEPLLPDAIPEFDDIESEVKAEIVHHEPVSSFDDGDVDGFDDFIEDYVEIVEHIGEENLDIKSASAQERGLKRTPLFSDLSLDELMGVICKLNICFCDMGDFVFRRGDEGQSIFVITSGAAELISYTKYGEEVKCATLTDGDFFGEHEYFSGTTRRSEVRAVTDLELFEIKRNEMAALTAQNPYMAKVLYDFYKERVLEKALALSKVFKHLSIEDRKELLEKVQVESYPEGTDVVKFDDNGESMFHIVSGVAEVWRRAPDGTKLSLVSLHENDYFGEVAVMLDRPRTSNVTAKTTLDVIIIDRGNLSGVFEKYPIIKKVLEDVSAKHVRENESSDAASKNKTS